MKLLLCLRRGLGDSVLFLSTLESVKSYYPACEITLLVPKAYAELYEHHPGVARIWTLEEKSFLAQVLRARQERFDWFLNFHATSRVRWLALFSGAKRRAADVHDEKRREELGFSPNAIEWNTAFLEKIWGKAPNIQRAVMPSLPLLSQEKAWAADYLQRQGLTPSRVVFLGLGASRITKRWPVSHFAKLTALLRDRYNLGALIISGPEDVEQRFAAQVLGALRVEGFRPDAKGKLHLTSGLSLRKMAALFSQCTLYVGNDSGPKHLAAACGIPTLTFFGPEDPNEWHPYSQDRHPYLFVPSLPCRLEGDGRWCGVPVCTQPRHICMEDSDPYLALEKIKSFVEVAS